MTARRPDKVLIELLETLEQAGLQHALMGGYAVVTWGVPRATFDVDVLVESATDRMQRCFEIGETRGFQIDDIYKTGWRDHVRDMPLVKMNGRRVPVVSAADLILLKLLANRPKDRLDVQNVLTVQGVPDPEYLESWAQTLGVAEALARALSEAGLR